MKDQLEAIVLEIYKGGIRYREAVDEFRKAFITTALRENGGNISKTAPTLGFHRNSLSRAIDELQVDVESVRRRRRPPQRVPTEPTAKKVSH